MTKKTPPPGGEPPAGRSGRPKAKTWSDRKANYKGVQLYRETAKRLLHLAKDEGYESIADYVEAIAGSIIEDKWQAFLAAQGGQPAPGPSAKKPAPPADPPRRQNRAG